MASRRARRASLAVATVLAACLSGCATNSPLSRLTRSASPYERYAETLAQAGLHETALGRDWVAAGQAALRAPAPAALPFRETGYFAPETPGAAAYRLDVTEGRRLSIDVTFETATPGRLFVDLFEVREPEAPRRVASLDPETTTLTLDVRRPTTFIVRLQPELLRGGRYSVTQRTLASLRFPVEGLDPRAVQSLFGAQRDAGRRDHEGIDIFAPRGTPVVAVARGVAQASTNTLGGNVVWLHEPGAGRTFYYAHLDRWAFEGTMTAQPGDVLGYVGNTGNARTTAPHLHFGLYRRGAVDPLPYLRADDPMPAPPTGTDRLGTLVRVNAARVPVRRGDAPGSETVRELPRGTVAVVTGVTARSHRVRLPDGSAGYVAAASLAAGGQPVRRQRLRAGDMIRESPTSAAPVVAVVDTPGDADVLGTFDQYRLVRTTDGHTGWLGEASGENAASSR
jgi:peptidoglycan LD-endopeptidase LytH